MDIVICKDIQGLVFAVENHKAKRLESYMSSGLNFVNGVM